MSFLNRVGNGASMTNSIDIVANSISIINPDGSLQSLTSANPVFTGTITGVDTNSVAQLAYQQSEINVNGSNISSLITWTNNSFISQLNLINLNGSRISNINSTLTSQLPLLATQTYVNNQLANLVGAAPAYLDTLSELSSAISDNSNFSTTILELISNKAPIAQPTFFRVYICSFCVCIW